MSASEDFIIHRFTSDNAEGGEANGVSSDEKLLFREALGRFATGVAIVTTFSEAGDKVGLTINSFTSVSLDPPYILWCMAKESESCSIFAVGRPFTINVLTESQKELAEIFSSQNNDRFKDVALNCKSDESPIIGQCLAWYDCRVVQVLDGGDHWIILGQVKRFGSRDDRPLLFQAGQYLS